MNWRARWHCAAAGALLAGAAHGEIDHRLSLSVVQIQAYSGAGRVSLGSGVVIGPGRVATNCHVTQRAKTVMVIKGAQWIKATTQHADVERDLCLLDIPQTQLPVARLGRSSRLKIGDALYLYGYPRGLGMAFSHGQVKALHAFKQGRIIETSADLNEGASGGGLFDDTGRLLGLATFFSAGHIGHNYAIPADWIADLARKPAREIAPIDGVPFWQDAAHMPAFLKMPGH